MYFLLSFFRFAPITRCTHYGTTPTSLGYLVSLLRRSGFAGLTTFVTRSGTGIGGLVAAHCLAQYPDIDATVCEGASCLEEVDAGIGFWPSKCKSSAKL